MDAYEARALAHRTDELIDRGMTRRGILRAVEAGDLLRIHFGRFVMATDWARLYPEQRHLVRVVAVTDAFRGEDAVCTLYSAGALWGLPLPRADLDRVHVAGPTSDGRTKAPSAARGGVARHKIAVPQAERTATDEIACTSLMRTVADLLRLARPETAIAAADAAARFVAAQSGESVGDADAEAPSVVAWRERLIERCERIRGARGVRQARELARLIDARANLPGESISRLYLVRLGFQAPRLQVPVRAPGSGNYFVDFGLDDVHGWGEFDGASKYTDERYTGGVDAWELVAAEKERQDWIHGTTGRPIIRWGWRHLTDIDTFAAHLRANRLTPRRRG